MSSQSRATTPPVYFGRSASMHQHIPQHQAHHHQSCELETFHPSYISRPAETYQQLRAVSHPPPPQQQQHQYAVKTGAPFPPATTPLQLLPEFPRSRPSSPTLPPSAGPAGVFPGTGSLHAHLGSHVYQKQSVNSNPAEYFPSVGHTTGIPTTTAQQQLSNPTTAPHTYQTSQYSTAAQTLRAGSLMGSTDAQQIFAPQFTNATHPPHPSHAAALDQMARHYERQEQERQRLLSLEQEEAEMAAEEASLRLQLLDVEAERRHMDSEMLAINSGWGGLFESDQWFHTTPYEDFSSQAAQVQYRCQLLTQQLHEVRQVLESHEIELRKYDTNDKIRDAQKADASRLHILIGRVEQRRVALRHTAERHFDAETQRERAARRYASDVDSNLQLLSAKIMNSADEFDRMTQRATEEIPSRANSTSGALETVTNRQNKTTVLQKSNPPSRTGSIAPLSRHDDNSSASFSSGRPRLVSFRPSPAASYIDRPPALQTLATEESSFCLALDDEGTSTEFSDSMFGLNGDSIAVSLCDTKRQRREPLITAM